MLIVNIIWWSGEQRCSGELLIGFRRGTSVTIRCYVSYTCMLQVLHCFQHMELLALLFCRSTLCGYRSMWRTLWVKHGLVVTEEVIRELLRQMDPVSINSRRRHRLSHRRTYTSRGSNDTWHVDGYDKLWPYGFLISGCINGYSRRIIWLECRHTNHDHAVIYSDVICIMLDMFMVFQMYVTSFTLAFQSD